MPELTLPVPVRSATRTPRSALRGRIATPAPAHRGGVIASDAALTALVLADAGLETVPGICVRRGRGVEFLDPVRVRPVHGGRGPAWSVATSPGELRAALAVAHTVDSHAWVEELAEGQELELPVVRLADGTCVVGAAHDAGAGAFFAQDRAVGDYGEFAAAVGLSDLDLARVRRIAQAAYDALDLHGIAAVTVVLDSPQVRVLAIDPDPALGPDSRALAAFAAAGWSGSAVRAAARGY